MKHIPSQDSATELIQKMDEVENLLTDFESKSNERAQTSQGILDLIYLNRWYISNIGIAFEKRHHLRRQLQSIVTVLTDHSVEDAVSTARFQYAVEHGHGLPILLQRLRDQSRYRTFNEMLKTRHHR